MSLPDPYEREHLELKVREQAMFNRAVARAEAAAVEREAAAEAARVAALPKSEPAYIDRLAAEWHARRQAEASSPMGGRGLAGKAPSVSATPAPIVQPQAASQAGNAPAFLDQIVANRAAQQEAWGGRGLVGQPRN